MNIISKNQSVVMIDKKTGISAIIGIIVGMAGTFFVLQGRISKLEGIVEQLQKSPPAKAYVDERAVKTNEALETIGSTLVIERQNDSLVRLKSPIKIIWKFQSNMVVQLYKNGQLVYNKEHSSGVALSNLETGKTELKLFVPGRSKPYKNVWIEIMDR